MHVPKTRINPDISGPATRIHLSEKRIQIRGALNYGLRVFILFLWLLIFFVEKIVVHA